MRALPPKEGVYAEREGDLPLEMRAAAAVAFALALAAAATAAATDTDGVGFFVCTRAVALFTSILRPSTIVPLSCSRARSASTFEAKVTKPNPYFGESGTQDDGKRKEKEKKN